MDNSFSVNGSLGMGDVLAQESQWLAGDVRDEERQIEPLSALCLSGGGIRSATFCLGVLQALAQKGMLERFHYLSTVSGGGYIGSWLSSWIKRIGLTAAMNSLANAGPSVEPVPVRRLRAYTNYLSPVWGLSTDFLSLVATFLRNLTLNWCVLLPLLAAILMVPRLELALLQWPAQAVLIDGTYYGLLTFAAILVVVTIAYIVADLPQGIPPIAPRDNFVLCCFAPLLAAAVILSCLVSWDVSRLTEFGRSWFLKLHPAVWLAVCGGAIHLLAVSVGIYWRRYRGLEPRASSLTDAFVSILSGMAGGACLYAAARLAPNLHDAANRELYATLSVPVLLVVFWIAGTFYAGAMSRFKSEDDREWWARSAAWWLGAGIVWLIAGAAVIYAPLWLLGSSWLQLPSGPQTAGAGAAILGILASAIGYWSKNGSKIKNEAANFIEASGVRLLDLISLIFIAALVLTMSIAVSCSLRLASPELKLDVWMAQANPAELGKSGWSKPVPSASAPPAAPSGFASAPVAAKAYVAYSVVLRSARADVLALAIFAMVVIGISVSTLIGVNTFSLHSMYGNRLARAYLGASNMERRPHWFTGFDPNDNLKFADLATGPAGEPPKQRRLFHVVNVALNLIKPAGDRLEWQQRKAASFTMSPLHCGSDALRFVPTQAYGAQDGGLSLGRAMAISGAAASPSMGYHTSTLVAFVMTFFNVRLGWWTPNPKAAAKVWPAREPRVGVKALLDEATASTTDGNAFVYLSDGGHFENLGLYEMVRRRCMRILVVDASCDPDYEFEDLEGAVRKIRIDFGVDIEFQEPLPTPARAKATQRHIAVARILYPDGTEGRLVYIKPVLSGAEPLDVTRFAMVNNKPGKAFPHQSTADQFFNEAQFESYRALGEHTVHAHFRNSYDVDWSLIEGIKVPNPGAVFVPIGTLPGAAGAFVPPTMPANDALLHGAAGGLRSMGQGALLATALTVGGVVGVTGSVGLRDNSEVALKRGGEVSLSATDKKLLTNVEAKMSAAEFTELQKQLKLVADTLKGVEESSSEHQAAERELTDVIKKIAVSSPAASTVTSAELRAMNQQLIKIMQEQPPSQANLEKLLNEANGYLKSINSAVKEVPPRRTIRAVTDGGTR